MTCGGSGGRDGIVREVQERPRKTRGVKYVRDFYKGKSAYKKHSRTTREKKMQHFSCTPHNFSYSYQSYKLEKTPRRKKKKLQMHSQ
jgi:hypothetical protein